MLKRAQSKGGDAPCVGSVKRAGVGDAVLRGAGDYAGSGRGGVIREGTQTYDRKAISFRKINNADPSPKNV